VPDNALRPGERASRGANRKRDDIAPSFDHLVGDREQGRCKLSSEWDKVLGIVTSPSVPCQGAGGQIGCRALQLFRSRSR
jgi:hypothetical protein